MKTNNLVILLIAGMAACTPADPAAQLEALRVQKASLESQIADLEHQLGDSLPQRIAKVKFVEATELKPQKFTHYIEVQGNVDTDQNIVLTSQMGGTIETIHVQEGDEVKKGQLLISLDAQVLENNIAEVRTSLKYANEMYTKQKELWDQKIGSEVQYLSAKNNKESLERRLATLREQLKQMKITAPINGVIDNITARVGELSSPGFPLGRIVNLSNFEIKAAVAENYSANVKNGTPVILWFPDLKEEYEATINYTGRVIDPVNRTFNIVIRLENPEIQIKPNMVCVVRIIDYSNDEAIVVPVGTVQKTDRGEYVFVAQKDGDGYVAKRRRITSSMQYNGQVLVAEGLEAGESLVTFGFQDLANGEAIRY